MSGRHHHHFGSGQSQISWRDWRLPRAGEHRAIATFCQGSGELNDFLKKYLKKILEIFSQTNHEAENRVKRDDHASPPGWRQSPKRGVDDKVDWTRKNPHGQYWPVETFSPLLQISAPLLLGASFLLARRTWPGAGRECLDQIKLN